MLRGAIPLLTATAMLLHAVMGCGASHPHPPTLATADAVDADPAGLSHVGCRGHAHCGSSGSSTDNVPGESPAHEPHPPCDGEHEPHSCDAAVCSFQAEKPVAPPVSDRSLDVGMPPLSARPTIGVASCDGERFAAHPWPPTLRSHLALNVLLN